MHIPDGYLDMKIASLFYVLTAVVLGYSLYRIKRERVNWALAGITASAIFAAQMLNWPIPGGTSAHFVGGALAGILLGPYAGCIAMACVLIVQCLVFADGGITALGANVWNMGVVDVFVGYYIYRLLERRNKFLAGFFAGWIGITLAAIFAGLEIGLSTYFHYSVNVTVPIMGMWHAVLGIIEGFITGTVVNYIHTTRPDILEGREVKIGRTVWIALAVLIILSPLFAYLAELVNYSEPLENVAKYLGVSEHPIYEGILPDYTVPGLNPYVGTLVSGAVGVAIVFILALAISRSVSR